MDPGPLKLKIKMKRERSWEGNSVAHQSQNIMYPEQSGRRTYTLTSFVPTTPQNPIDLTVESPEHNGTETEDDQPSENANMQLVLYEPPGKNSGEIVPAPVRSEPPPLRRHSFPGHTARVLPAVGAFTVQCANCFKWRLIPTKEKYEEIREHILEQPFLCETAREWRPSISCDDEPDIEQDSSRLWAIDKPNIAQPPPGWQRLLRIRGEGSTKFADVYYESPTGKRLRSMVEVQKYLQDHPEYIEAGATMTQFSFQIPRPLQENYVRKRPARPATFLEDGGSGIHRFDGTAEVPPLAWAGPNEDTDLRLGVPDPRATYYEAHVSELANEAAKRKKTPTKKRFDSQLLDGTSQVNVEDTLRL